MGANWFIGIPVPHDGWFDVLPPVPAGCRRFAPTDLHVTVAFLGAVDEIAARAAFRAVVWEGEPRRVTLDIVAPMGSPRRYSALSALLDDGRIEIENAIARARGGAYEAAHVPADERPAKAHITIARPTRRASHLERKNALDWATGIVLPKTPLLLDTIALYTWSDDRAAQLFSIIDRAPLPKIG